MRSTWNRLPNLGLSEEPVDSDNDYAHSAVFKMKELEGLAVLLSTKDAQRTSLLSSGQEITWFELYASILLDIFCFAVVVPVYNDYKEHQQFDLSRTVERVNCWSTLFVQWIGDELKLQYTEFRSQFTLADDR